MILVNQNIKPGEPITNCHESYLPRNLKEIPLYSNVNELLHMYDNSWSDSELLGYFDKYENYDRYFIGSLGDKDKLYTKDFYESYPADINDIWYEAGKLNDKEVFREGVDFWKFILEPYMGTNLIQKKVLQKIDVRYTDPFGVVGEHGTVIEWWEVDNLINTYTLKMEKYPGDEKLIFLAQASLKIKNISSKLSSITDSACPTALRLDIGAMNVKRLNGNLINYYFDIGICFAGFNQLVFDTHDEYGANYISRESTHYWIGGIAEGVLDGVSAENVSSYDIVNAKKDALGDLAYDNFITGIKTDAIVINSATLYIYSEAIPGVLLGSNNWDGSLWTEADLKWETGSYSDHIKVILDDQSFNMTPGLGLTYLGYGFFDNQIAPSIYETGYHEEYEGSNS